MLNATRAAKSALDPDDALIYGPEIDQDLGISDRARRKWIKSGKFPKPAGYVGGRAVWRRGDYLAARERLIAEGRPRRPGQFSPAPAAA